MAIFVATPPIFLKPTQFILSKISQTPLSLTLSKTLLDSRRRKMATYLWRKYSEYLYTRWEKTVLWDMIDPYRRPKSFKPLITIYIAAFYTGVIGSAITEQLYKEKYWEEHPGEAVPLMKPKFYYGPWKVLREDHVPKQ